MAFILKIHTYNLKLCYVYLCAKLNTTCGWEYERINAEHYHDFRYLWRQIYARCLQALYFRSSSILEFNYYNTICWSLQGFKLFASWCRRKLSYFPFKLPSIFEPSELLATKTYVNQIIKISCFAWENLKGFWNLNIPDYAKMPPRHIVTNQTYYDYLC